MGAIYILDAWQRQGIGRALVHLLASHLRARGYAAMYAWALRDNPYAAFYGKLGAIEVGWQTRQIGEFSREEIAHGWSDIAALVALLSAGSGACSD
ncbi:MAG TPA: GNAT family N-acetyltransferase [Candidatus Lokiarchaeia archaeon]|nr:GNAT family N-acetyltransferase [Candidatus Lokiarchaeia archaeon]